MNSYDENLDTSGLYCPLPILKTKKRLSTLAKGSILQVIATDPGSQKDFTTYFNESEDDLISSVEDQGHFIYRIRKS